MDVLKALRELYLEKSRLDRLIAICESKIKEQDRRLSRSKRGRKSMSADERKIVSERMRTYWASRRKGQPEEPSGQTDQHEPAPGQREAPSTGQDQSGFDNSARAASNT